MSNYSDSSFDESSQNTSWYKVYQLVPEGATVLDVGCSSGNFGAVLQDRKHCVVDGVELDPKDVKLAARKLRQVWNLNVESDDISDIPSGAYDAIYFGDVVEHLFFPSQTLKRIQPLLKPDGKIIFSIPNMGHIGVRLALLAGKFEYTETGLLDKTHLHFYTQDEVVRVFEEAGYRLSHLDFVEKDYPKQLLKQQLARYGLTANKTFYETMSQTDASAFQFVGTAQPAKAKRHTLKQFGPIDLFERFYEDTKTNHQLETDELRRQINGLETKLSHKENHPYRAVARHIKRKIKS